MIARVLVGIVAALAPALGSGRASADGPALGLDDLAAYRAALTDRTGTGTDTKPGGAPVAVGFRELWSHPGAYQGRRVEVRGRVVRRFRQGAFGTFPPLAEAWAVSPAGDPFCLVYPESRETSAPEPAGTVRFAGTFLKQVRYQGGDGPRLAPLIVGPRPPAPLEPAPSKAPRPGPSIRWLDGTVGLAAACFVALVLTRQHLRRPRRPPERDPEPPPVFVEAVSFSDSDHIREGEAPAESFPGPPFPDGSAGASPSRAEASGLPSSTMDLEA